MFIVIRSCATLVRGLFAASKSELMKSIAREQICSENLFLNFTSLESHLMPETYELEIILNL